MSESPPSFLVFLTDDHGHWTLPCYGNREVHVPNLARLAETGMVFDAATTPSPVCSPARASFWTGRIPSAHGIHDWIPEARDPGTFPHIDRMPGNLVERFRSAGYQTAGVGKYHCNHAESNPLGADFWFVQQTPIQYVNRCRQVWNDNGVQVEHEGFQAPAMADAAIRFLRERDKDKPFFLFVGFVNTHTPHTDEPEALVDRYRSATFADIPRESFSDAHGNLRFGLKPEPEWREQTANYYASVTAIDEQVGRVLDELQARGLTETTHVVYTSDHGHMNGQHGLHTKGNATVPVNFLEESIRVPLVWNGPGVRAGRTGAFVNHCDTYATLLDLAGAEPMKTTAEGARLPGTSYRDVLQGTPEMDRSTRICEYGNARMIQRGGLKLILRFPGPKGRFGNELYDLNQDPRERRNMIDQPEYTEAVSTLTEELNAYFARFALEERTGTDLTQLANLHGSSPWNVDPDTFPVLYQ